MVGVMSQQIKKVLGVEPSDLSSVPKTHIVESYTLKKKEERKVGRIMSLLGHNSFFLSFIYFLMYVCLHVYRYTM